MTMIATNCPAPVRPTDRSIAPARFPVMARIARAHALWRQRRALAALDDEALRDIGITRAQARAEAARPVWDAPQNWHG